MTPGKASGDMELFDTRVLGRQAQKRAHQDMLLMGTASMLEKPNRISMAIVLIEHMNSSDALVVMEEVWG